MTQCANYGAVAGADRYTGGVAGYTTARSKTKILACKNEASVSSANTGARVSTGSVVGNAQNLIWGGCTAADSALPKLGRTGKVAEQEVKDVCPDCTPKDAPQDAALPDSFTVTFRANGETVAQRQAMMAVRRLIEEEDPHAPLSDQAISERLKEEGMNVARRTVAKYRERMKFPIAQHRKRH